MQHVIVTRFSVPRPGGASQADRHADPEWLATRLQLFRRFYVPSVGRLGVPAVLLCSSATSARVADATADLGWVRVVEQDEWRGGWSGRADQVLTRLDSDDALREGWFAAVDGAPAHAEVVCTRRFLRLDLRTGAVHRYLRWRPSPLAAFRAGQNPYAHDHEVLPQHHLVVHVREAFLLQVALGGNVSSRYPKPFRPRAPRQVVRQFGIDPGSFGTTGP